MSDQRLLPCEGKQRHVKPSLAYALAKKMLGKGKGSGEAYRCRHCGFFHVGTMRYQGIKRMPKKARTPEPQGDEA